MPTYEFNLPNGKTMTINSDRELSDDELNSLSSENVPEPQQNYSDSYNPIDQMKADFEDTANVLKGSITKNEAVKNRANRFLASRNRWEQEHPVISDLQKAYQPGYRGDRTQAEFYAKYGTEAPLGETIKNAFAQAGQDLVAPANLAITAATGGGGSLGRQIAMGGLQGAGTYLTGELADRGLSKDTGTGALGAGSLGSVISGVIPMTRGVGRIVSKAAKSLPKSIRQQAGISSKAYERLKTSPRGVEISSRAEEIGSEEFINDLANKFKTSVDTLRNQEREAFAIARDKAIQNNLSIETDLKPLIREVKKDLRAKGLIEQSGNLTPAGKNATNISKFLKDLEYYSKGVFDVDKLQNLKTDVLDAIIDYRPNIGQSLTGATRKLQSVAKKLRRNVNTKLNDILGSEYTTANKKMSEILDILDDNPEIKDLTNAKNIDTLATKLKKAGTTNVGRKQGIQRLDEILKENGLNVSNYSIMDDILDYQAAKDINNYVRTGLSGGLANTLRNSVAQPIIEETMPFITREKPVLNAIGTFVGRSINNPVTRGVADLLLNPQFGTGIAIPTLFTERNYAGR